jgi:hypothetical protein
MTTTTRKKRKKKSRKKFEQLDDDDGKTQRAGQDSIGVHPRHCLLLPLLLPPPLPLPLLPPQKKWGQKKKTEWLWWRH